ncbi:MAG: ATP-dependent helicase [Lachnospiraceae bacterium]|nr:ATP-dependent helicase [Lachnospiraceae bacterium]
MLRLKLNESQSEAVKHVTGPAMVISGPGSGKTTVISHRVKYLIEELNVSGSDILVITFSKASAIEMKERINELIGSYEKAEISTFHSFFFKILRAHSFVKVEDVLTENEKRHILSSILNKLKLNAYAGDDFMESLEEEISLIKNDLLDLDYYNSMIISNDYFKSIFSAYEEYKKVAGKLDFDDMLEKAYVLLRDNPSVLDLWSKRYQYVLIDEFQDINKAQYNLIKLISANHKNIFAVGDDDQSIYRFRGARPEFMLNFSKDYENAEKIILSTNYRSTDEIIAFSNKIIENNKNRFEKSIKGTGINGTKPRLIMSIDIEEEAFNIGKIIKAFKNISYHDIAVLYRTNIQARAFADAFMDMNIPFKIKDGFSLVYEHWIFKDIRSYFILAMDRRSNEDFIRIINKPNRFISRSHIKNALSKKIPLMDYLYTPGILQSFILSRVEELMYHLNVLKEKSSYDAIKYIRYVIGYDEYIKSFAEYRKIDPKGLFEIINEITESSKNHNDFLSYLNHVETIVEETKENFKDLNKDGVSLSTIHSAKGLEYHTVFIAGCVEGLIPYEKSRLPYEIEEERRLLYVAVTRAKRNLYISAIEKRHGNDVKLSRFLEELKSK